MRSKYAWVLFASTLDRGRRPTEVSKLWNISKSAWYAPAAVESINELIKAGLLDCKTGIYHARLDVYPEGIEAIGIKPEGTDKVIVDEWSKWQPILMAPQVRETLLSPKGEQEVMGLGISQLREIGWAVPLLGVGVLTLLCATAEVLERATRKGTDEIVEVLRDPFMEGLITLVLRRIGAPIEIRTTALSSAHLKALLRFRPEVYNTKFGKIIRKQAQEHIKRTKEQLERILETL